VFPSLSPSTGLSVLCIGIFLLASAFFLCKKHLKNDEYVSDIFAIEKLRDTYLREDLIIIIKNGFNELQRHFTNYKEEDHPLDTIQNFIFDITEYHPTNKQGIENIKAFFKKP
jgi:hypothetical protein